MEAIETALTTGWTNGSVGVWTLVATVFGFWWKGLPAFIDAWDRRQASTEQRARDFLEEERARFKEVVSQLEAQVTGLRMEVDSLRRENADLRGLVANMQQGQMAAGSVVARAIKEAKDGN